MVHRTPFAFFRGDLRLAGRLFRNTDRLDVRQPAIMVTGSWLIVKEQMPELYATRLAERGYTTFTFDFCGFGESAGEPRQAEIPDRKIADLIAAAPARNTDSRRSRADRGSPGSSAPPAGITTQRASPSSTALERQILMPPQSSDGVCPSASRCAELKTAGR
jgi:hypothetical protein